jgi:hypothetical protein
LNTKQNVGAHAFTKWLGRPNLDPALGSPVGYDDSYAIVGLVCPLRDRRTGWEEAREGGMNILADASSKQLGCCLGFNYQPYRAIRLFAARKSKIEQHDLNGWAHPSTIGPSPSDRNGSLADWLLLVHRSAALAARKGGKRSSTTLAIFAVSHRHLA